MTQAPLGVRKNKTDTAQYLIAELSHYWKSDIAVIWKSPMKEVSYKFGSTNGDENSSEKVPAPTIGSYGNFQNRKEIDHRGIIAICIIVNSCSNLRDVGCTPPVCRGINGYR